MKVTHRHEQDGAILEQVFQTPDQCASRMAVSFQIFGQFHDHAHRHQLGRQFESADKSRTLHIFQLDADFAAKFQYFILSFQPPRLSSGHGHPAGFYFIRSRVN